MAYSCYSRAFLFVGGLFFANLTHAATSTNTSNDINIVEPGTPVKAAQVADIDTEEFELGIYAGTLSVEDFSANLVTGLSLSYHVNHRFFAQLHYGRANIDSATFEDVISTSADFLGDGDDFIYYHVSAGYKVLRGRSFFGKAHKYNSILSILAGVGSLEFNNETNTSIILGTSYKVVLTDWLTVNLDFRNHIVDRDFLDDAKTTYNTELVMGLNLLF